MTITIAQLLRLPLTIRVSLLLVDLSLIMVASRIHLLQVFRITEQLFTPPQSMLLLVLTRSVIQQQRKILLEKSLVVLYSQLVDLSKLLESQKNPLVYSLHLDLVYSESLMIGLVLDLYSHSMVVQSLQRLIITRQRSSHSQQTIKVSSLLLDLLLIMVASPIHLQQVLLITVQLSILLPSTLLLELIHSAAHLPRRMLLEKSLVVLYSPLVVQSKQQHSMIPIAHLSLPYLVMVSRNLSSVRSWADLSSPLVVELRKSHLTTTYPLLLPIVHLLIMVLSAAQLQQQQTTDRLPIH